MWAYNRRKYVQAIFSIFIMILIIVYDGRKSLLLCHVLYFINFYIYLFVIFKNLLVFMYFSCYCCVIVFESFSCSMLRVVSFIHGMKKMEPLLTLFYSYSFLLY